MKTEIIILGSGTGVPSIRRGAPGFALKLGKETFLFDSGSGTLNRLLRAGIDYREIDYIFYSHFHPDHVAELVPFMFACKYHTQPRTKKLKLFGPPGLKRYYGNIHKLYKRWIRPETYRIQINELKGNPRKSREWTVSTRRLQHSKASIGYRVRLTNGKTIVYSGDTNFSKSLIDLSRDADLLILECSFPDRLSCPGHLTPRLAGKVAAAAGCRHLVLTHFYPVCDKYDIRSACRKEYKGKLTLARDNLRIKL